jgi:hypothetical protein
MCAHQRPAQGIVVEHAATKLLVDEIIMVRFIYMGSGSVTSTATGPTVCHWSMCRLPMGWPEVHGKAIKLRNY